MIHKIIVELNESNSTNHKLAVLKKYKDSEFLKKVLKMTYDHVTFTYGMTRKKVMEFEQNELLQIDLEFALNTMIHNFTTREVTGHAALQMMRNLVHGLPEEDGELLLKILDRDLKINVGKTQINKVWKDLLVKPAYCRCDTYNKKTSKNIKFPALCQLKADGMAIFVNIQNDCVTCYTRSGKSFELYSLQYLKENSELIDNTIQGEFLIDGETDRSNANGLINSLIKYKKGDNKSLSEEEAKKIEEKIIYQIWDIVPNEEILKAKNREKTKIQYKDRFQKIQKLFS